MNKALINSMIALTEEEQEILDGRQEVDKNRYMKEQYSNVIDSKKLLEKGKLITIRPHTRFIRFPTHTHNYVEVVYMCQGSIVHIVNGERVVLETGELLFLSQNAIQEIEEAGRDDIAVNFIILPEFFDNSLMMLGKEENIIKDFLIGCLKHKDSKVPFLHFRVTDVLPIQNLIENLIWTLMNKQRYKRSINQITMGLLILQLLNHTDKMMSGKDNLAYDIIVKVYRFIEEHYKEGELSDLANEMGYELFWLSRTIKSLTGHNYTDMVQKKRLNQSVYLLENTKLSVADIGIAVGYTNTSYFYRLFKKRFGMSPKTYRITNLI